MLVDLFVFSLLEELLDDLANDLLVQSRLVYYRGISASVLAVLSGPRMPKKVNF